MNSKVIVSTESIRQALKSLKSEMDSQFFDDRLKFIIITILHSSLTQKDFKVNESCLSYILELAKKTPNDSNLDSSKLNEGNLESPKDCSIDYMVRLLFVCGQVSSIDFTTRQQISSEINF